MNESQSNHTKHPDFIILIPGSNPTVDKTIGTIVIICMIIGTTGNIISFLFFWKRRHSSFPQRLYTIVSSADTLTSLAALPVVAVLFNDRHPVFFNSYTLCGIWTLLFNFLQRFSMFMVLIMSSTRAIAILFPFYRVRKRVALAACGCFGVFLLVVDSTYLGLGELRFVYWSPAGCCGVGPTAVPWNYTWTIYILQILVIVFTISLTVFISFVLSLVVLLRRKQISCTERDKQSREVSITIALFTAVFLFCNLPLFTLQLLDNSISWFKLDRFLDRSPFIRWYGWLLSHFFFTTFNAALNPCLYHLRMKKLRSWVFVRLLKTRSDIGHTFGSIMMTGTMGHGVRVPEGEEGAVLVRSYCKPRQCQTKVATTVEGV